MNELNTIIQEILSLVLLGSIFVILVCMILKTVYGWMLYSPEHGKMDKFIVKKIKTMELTDINYQNFGSRYKILQVMYKIDINCILAIKVLIGSFLLIGMMQLVFGMPDA